MTQYTKKSQSPGIKILQIPGSGKKSSIQKSEKINQGVNKHKTFGEFLKGLNVCSENLINKSSRNHSAECFLCSTKYLCFS